MRQVWCTNEDCSNTLVATETVTRALIWAEMLVHNAKWFLAISARVDPAMAFAWWAGFLNHDTVWLLGREAASYLPQRAYAVSCLRESGTLPSSTPGPRECCSACTGASIAFL